MTFADFKKSMRLSAVIAVSAILLACNDHSKDDSNVDTTQPETSKKPEIRCAP